MSEPVVSFCIPTYNRSRYLDSLLTSLQDQLAAFPHSYELVISDNASPDDTQDVLARFESSLPIRHFRQDTNIGGAANWHFVVTRARGEFIVSLGDDDALLGEQTAQAITCLNAMPSVGAAFAPWVLYDLPTDRQLGRFYSHPDDFLVQRGDHQALLDGVLRHRIWPEIGIVRRKLLHRVMPRVPEHAFYAFVHAGEYLSRSDVVFLKDPFYVFVVRHFEGDKRAQTGTQEAMKAWDRYRGGLEYLMSRFSSNLTAPERNAYVTKISNFIGERMAMAVKLRVQNKADPIDTFYLAARATALGAARKLPEPMQHLRSKAALHFLTHDAELNRDKRQLVCVGSFEDGLRRGLARQGAAEVSFHDALPDLQDLHDALVFVRDAKVMDQLDGDPLLATHNVHIVSEADLMAKFSC